MGLTFYFWFLKFYVYCVYEIHVKIFLLPVNLWDFIDLYSDVFFFLFETVLSCSLGWPETYCIDQAALNLQQSSWYHFPSARITGVSLVPG